MVLAAALATVFLWTVFDFKRASTIFESFALLINTIRSRMHVVIFLTAFVQIIAFLCLNLNGSS